MAIIDMDSLLIENEGNYKIKGKHVFFTSKNGRSKKIVYDDFFKVGVRYDNQFHLYPFESEGIDILSFALLGMCIGLSQYSLFEADRVGFASHIKYLDDLRESDKFRSLSILSDIVGYSEVLSRVDRIYLDESRSFQTIRKHAEDEKFKSLYFLSLYGTSLLRPNVDKISHLFPYLACVSFSEEGRKNLVDIFCKYVPVIINAGLQVFDTYSYDFLDAFGDFDLSNYGNIRDCLKFCSYGKFSLNKDIEVSDLEGIAFYIAYRMACTLYFGNSEANDYIFDNLLGNDCVRKYFKDGDIKCVVSAIFKDRIFSFEYDSYRSKVNFSCLYTLIKFLSDIYEVGFRLESFDRCASLTQGYADYKTICYCLFSESRSSTKKFMDEYTSFMREHENKIKYYKNRNNILSERNRILANELKSLNSLKSTSNVSDTVISESDYSLLESKNISLQEKCASLESRLRELENGMEDLISSLEVEEQESIDGVSQEEMIDFLNGFKICFVGGRFDMKDKLNDLGLYNFIQIVTLNDLQRISNVDFVITLTRFVSHALVNGTLSRVGSDRYKNNYFNGTNLSSLIVSCYDFINKYFK